MGSSRAPGADGVECRLPTTTALIHRPHVIAAASIVLACAQLEMQLPSRLEPVPVALLELAREEGEEGELEPYWADLLGVGMDEVRGKSLAAAG